MPVKPDEFQNTAKATLIAILVQIMGGNVFVNVTGGVLWMLAGMYLASDKYHQDAGERWRSLKR